MIHRPRLVVCDVTLLVAVTHRRRRQPRRRYPRDRSFHPLGGVYGVYKTVYRRRIDWKSPFPCDMSHLGKNFNVASEMMLIKSCRLSPQRLFFSIEICLSFLHYTAQQRLSVWIRRRFVPTATPVSNLLLTAHRCSTFSLHCSTCARLTTFITLFQPHDPRCQREASSFVCLLLNDVSCSTNSRLSFDRLESLSRTCR